MTAQERIDEFVVGLRSRLLDFIEKGDLIPHGHHYDLRLSLTRYRDQIEVETKTYMNGPNWEPTKELPTEGEWKEVLGLSCFKGRGYKPTTYRNYLLVVKENNVEGSRPACTHYTTAVNNLLAAFNSEYRLFSNGRWKGFVLRRIR